MSIFTIILNYEFNIVLMNYFKIIITGGAGFIGGNLIRHLLNSNYKVLNLDKITYAADLKSLKFFDKHKNYKFKKVDIADYKKIYEIINEFKPHKIINLAAESHVDRSIESSKQFIRSNIQGTVSLLESSYKFYKKNKLKNFVFHHVSTDEVYGDLASSNINSFTENTNYDPGNPYSASKASADHFVNAWHKTYELPTVISNCSNNFGPFQYPEKLIPTAVMSLLFNKKINIYGKGDQVRDWIHVNDHVRALEKIFIKGRIGNSYNVGANNPIRNIDLIKKICKFFFKITNKHYTDSDFKKYINFVIDRPGHDKKYLINAKKIKKELNWRPIYNFDDAIYDTVKWYIDNFNWWNKLYKDKAIKRRGLSIQ